MPRSNLSSSQKSSADEKVKVGGPSNEHCYSSYTTQPYKWIWTKNKNTVLDAPASTFARLHLPVSTFIHLRPPASTYVHMLWSTCIHFDPHASNFVHQHPPKSTFIHFCPPGSTCIHMCSTASICVHLYPLAYICIHFHPPAFTCVHQHPMHPTTSIFAHLRLVIWSSGHINVAFWQFLPMFKKIPTIFNFLYLLANYFQLWYI